MEKGFRSVLVEKRSGEEIVTQGLFWRTSHKDCRSSFFLLKELILSSGRIEENREQACAFNVNESTLTRKAVMLH